MTPEELAHTNTSAQIRLGADAHLHIKTLGWVDTRQEVGMTPEERADKALDIELHFTCIGANDWQPLVASIAASIRAAIAEEREACAQEADYVCKCALHDELMPEHVSACSIRNEIAAAIRARGQA